LIVHTSPGIFKEREREREREAREIERARAGAAGVERVIGFSRGNRLETEPYNNIRYMCMALPRREKQKPVERGKNNGVI